MYVPVNRMRPNRLQNALATLGNSMQEVNAAIDEMRQGVRCAGLTDLRGPVGTTRRFPTPRAANDTSERLG
jgi:hypothetical protein